MNETGPCRSLSTFVLRARTLSAARHVSHNPARAETDCVQRKEHLGEKPRRGNRSSVCRALAEAIGERHAQVPRYSAAHTKEE